MGAPFGEGGWLTFQPMSHVYVGRLRTELEGPELLSRTVKDHLSFPGCGSADLLSGPT